MFYSPLVVNTQKDNRCFDVCIRRQ